MHQSEALWLAFSGRPPFYPCAIKIAAGKINAISGNAWSDGLSDEPQDYAVLPGQRWLDGFNVADGYIRQFVAMPLGEGYTAEEQITGKAEHGGLQISVFPMKREVYAEHFERKLKVKETFITEDYFDIPAFCRRAVDESANPEMGLAPGGLMRQEIYEDEYGPDAWDQWQDARCYVHLVNSAVYRKVTGRHPPHRPPTARDYNSAGLPWFDYYSDRKPLPGVDALGNLTSLAALMIRKGAGLLGDNDPVEPGVIKTLGEARPVRHGKL
jgi:hypothetical protein